MKKEQFAITILIIVTLVCLFIILPIPNKPVLEDKKVRLGIDLSGGIEVRYRVYDPNNMQRKLSSKDAQDVLEILRKRIDTEGLTEPKMNVSEGKEGVQIIIQLAGVNRTGWLKYKDLVEKQGVLEWRECTREDNEKLEAKGTKGLPEDCVAIKNDIEKGRDTPPWNKEYIAVKKFPVVTGGQVSSTSPNPDPEGRGYWIINFVLKPDGAKIFGEMTARQVEKGRVAVTLDGKLLTNPNVNKVIKDSGYIESFAPDEARRISNMIASGSLPFAVGKKRTDGTYDKGLPEVENEVGPTLGEDSIRRGVLASVVTLALVAFFMIIYYRTGGFVAVLTLILNMAFLITMLIFLGAVLTLPGIAGLVLTIGMAVDANILILERVREEQKKGKTALQAFEHATSRATVTIVDANLTTLLIGFVLYFFGSGSVKGFAVTLSLGILTTLFSVLYCGGIITRYLLHSGSLKQFNMMQLFSESKVNFVKFLKPCGVISLLLVIASVVLVVTNADKSLGLDFTGGIEAGFKLTEPEKIETVREKIGSVKKGGVAKYGGADIQTMAEAATQGGPGDDKNRASGFMVRTKGSSLASLDELKEDIQILFKDNISHEPFEDIKSDEMKKFIETEKIFGKDVGTGFYLYLKSDKFDSEKVSEEIKTECKGILSLTENKYVNVKIIPHQSPPKRLVKLAVLITKEDADKLKGVREKLDEVSKKEASNLKLSDAPFLTQSSIGPAAAREMVETALLATVISWALMIAYVAIRFFMSFNFGFAAVVALIHDAVVSLGAMVLMGIVIPKGLGLDFDITLNTLAAVLTIIGYSVNDTIVIFDRIRENLVLNKKAGFSDIINWSVNQTLSRTIITSFTVWISVVVMYGFTMNSSSGIATLTFPLLIGVVAGTYSTIYVASPLVMLLYRGKRPQVTVT